jgi:hypothetical protein
MRAQTRLLKVSTCYGMQSGRTLQHGLQNQLPDDSCLPANRRGKESLAGSLACLGKIFFVLTPVPTFVVGFPLCIFEVSDSHHSVANLCIVGCCIVDVPLSTLPASPVSPFF